MSWLFSQVQVEEYLADISLDGEQSAPLSGNNTQVAYCAPDKMTKFSRLSRFGMTYKPLTESRGEELLTLYLADFHAKTSAPLAKVQESQEKNQECGNTWQGSLAKLDPNTSLWKTAQCSLLEDLELSLQTFPRWGLMQNGALYPQQTLAQTISVKEYGFVERFPTPTAHNAKEQNSPSEALRNEPTLASRVGGKLNPMWVEWLMGWSIGWTDLKPLATDKCLYVQQLHGSFYLEKENRQN